MNGVLLWIAGLLVALLASLFAVPYFIDWNTYRDVFEEEASRILGREVRVGGDVNLRLLPAPYVSFRKIRIAEGEDAAGQAFLRADSFTMWLAVPPLLTGIIEAKEVELKKPALRLQVGTDGAGNWSKFHFSKGALPFVPRDVALQSLKISDGLVTVLGPAGQELTKIELADAEVAAPALEGPFRFRGNVAFGGERAEIRGSTGTVEPDGTIRLKTAIRAARSGNTYTVEGALASLAGRPRFEGQLLGTFPRPAVASQAARPSQPGTGQPVAGAPAAAGTGGSPFELRSQIRADVLGAQLGEIAFNFEQQGQPQLLTGTAEADWRGSLRISTDLTSHLLDLDKMAGADGDADPLSTLRKLTSGVGGFFPGSGDVLARITIDQANLGNDLVTGIRLALQSNTQGLRVRELRAGLPGGARIDVSGALTRQDGDGFDGTLLLRGAHLGRFLGWAGRGSALASARSDGSFLVNSGLVYAPGSVDFRRAVVDFSGSRMTGDLQYKWGGRKELSLTLEAARADLSDILPGPLGPQLATALLNLGSAPTAAGEATRTLEDYWAAMPVLAESDLRLRLRANRVASGDRELRNLDAEVLVRSGTLSIPALTVATDSGFRLQLEGEVKSFATKPQGILRGVVSAPDDKAVEDAAAAFGTEGRNRASSGWLKGLAPVRLAFVGRFGASGGAAAELTADGTVLGGRLAASLLLDQGLLKWREAPLEATLSAEGSGAARLLMQLATNATPRSAAVNPSPSSTRLLLKATGVPARDLAVVLRLPSPAGELSVRGTGTLDGKSPARFSGNADVQLSDGAAVFDLAGLPVPIGSEGMALSGSAAISLAGDDLRLQSSLLHVGGSTVSGEMAFTGPAAARRLDAKLKTDTLSLPRLAGFLLAAKPAQANGASSENTNWTERTIDLSRLDNLGGRLQVAAERVSVGNLELKAAALEVALEPGQISVEKLEGHALGGAFQTSFKLERSSPGPTLSGVIGFWDMPLERLSGHETPMAAGKAQLAGQLKGLGSTPQTILSSLSGKGELEFKGARLERLSPGAVETAGEAFISGRVDPSRESFAQVLKTALAAGQLPIGSRKIPFEVANGAIRFGAFTVETPEARATNETTIDIQEFKIDSAWRIEPKATRAKPGAGKGPLPPITIVYVGPLTAFANIEPRIQADGLERELTVRRMEREVESLERLRREDEARAKAEAERLKMPDATPPAAPQRIEVPFVLPPGASTPAPSSTIGAQPKLSNEPLPAPLPQSLPARPMPAQPPWQDQFGRGDRS